MHYLSSAKLQVGIFTVLWGLCQHRGSGGPTCSFEGFGVVGSDNCRHRAKHKP